MASLLDKVNKSLYKAGIKPRTEAARNWLIDKISSLRMPTNRSNVLNDPNRISASILVGKMFIFAYDAKYKEVLPVWDRFPLVLPMEMYSDGFLGLNLHYLDPGTRLVLLDRLHDFINNDKYDNTTRFNMSYNLLKNSRRYRMIEPCIKRYLYSHIVSSIIYIEPDSWETACFLPTEKFVYRDTKEWWNS
jgi:hypothetical protein